MIMKQTKFKEIFNIRNIHILMLIKFLFWDEFIELSIFFSEIIKVIDQS